MIYGVCHHGVCDSTVCSSDWRFYLFLVLAKCVVEL